MVQVTDIDATIPLKSILYMKYNVIMAPTGNTRKYQDRSFKWTSAGSMDRPRNSPIGIIDMIKKYTIPPIRIPRM